MRTLGDAVDAGAPPPTARRLTKSEHFLELSLLPADDKVPTSARRLETEEQ
jgi:hypothetical protein